MLPNFFRNFFAPNSHFLYFIKEINLILIISSLNNCRQSINQERELSNKSQIHFWEINMKRDFYSQYFCISEHEADKTKKVHSFPSI
jgi:hypothetical protein